MLAPAPAKDDPTAGVVHCEHGERCGGCSLLGVPEVEQHARKRAAVRAALARFPRLAGLHAAEVCAAQPRLGYRARAKLVVARDGSIGLYARASHDVVDIPHCRVLSPELARVAEALRAQARAHEGALFGVDLRAVQDGEQAGVLVTLIGEPAALSALQDIARALAALPGVLGVAVSQRERSAQTLLAAEPRAVAGAAYARDRLAPGAPYHLVGHGSFAQAHRGQAATIAERIVRELGSRLGSLQGARVLELYAGSGALGLWLCRQGARVLSVERFAPALALVEQAARAQAIAGLAVRAGDAAQVAAELARAGERFDAVIVNPPRRGVAPVVRAAVCALAPRALAYVSCDPETLARDLDQLALLGLSAAAIEPFDMMPLSDDVECLALLAPAPPPPLPVLHEDEDWIAVDKPAHVPTTPQGDGVRSLLQSVRAQQGLPELTPVHRLDAGTSGICLFAKRRTAVAALGRALKAGEKQYLALARGITRAKGSINRPLRDGAVQQPSRTRYSRQQVVSGHSLLRVRPDQGRTHQIRRHLAAIGHPVLGDTRYGHAPSNRHFEQKHGLDRPFLHLARVELVDPRRGRRLVLEARLPGELESVLARLR